MRLSNKSSSCKTQEVPESPGFWGHASDVAKLEHKKDRRQRKIEDDSAECSAEVATDDADITSTTCDDVDEISTLWNIVDVFADEMHPAIVLQRDKERDVIVRKQSRKKHVRSLWVWRTQRVRTTWLLLDHGALRVLEKE